MNSSAHRATMLISRYTYLGVGFYESDDGVYYWVQLFATINPDADGCLTFDANGGLINSDTTYKIYGIPGTYVWLSDAPEPYKVTDIPDPVRDGYTFAGWYDTKTPSANRKPLKAAAYTTNGMIVYAKWVPNS